MKKIPLGALTAVLAMLAFVPALRAEVTEDEQGRVVLVNHDSSGRVCSRTVLEADGARHTTATEYWPKSQVAKRTAEEDRDAAGRPVKRTTSLFDRQGRVRERSAVSIDATGRQRGTRTLFSYDAQGRPHETTSPLQRQARQAGGAS
jgi:YD repeat-containing protein